MMDGLLKKFGIFSEISRTFRGLNKRERRLLIGALLLTLIVVLDLAVVSPMYRSSVRLRKEVKNDRVSLVEMQDLYEKHKKYEVVLRGSESVPKNFSIMTYLQGVANAVGVSYDSIQPRTSSDNATSYIDVRLKNINLYQLTRLLYRIELGGEYQLKVKRLNVRTSYNNQSLLDVGLQVVIPGASNE
ncbi:MAG: type II secretion system protein M [Deltaproteobacteria bacterium]|nr:type II secretion system protein M [Deltaproteobacteria bacterium]